MGYITVNKPRICAAALKNYMELLIQFDVTQDEVEKTVGYKIQQLTDPDESIPLSTLVQLEKESPYLTNDKSIALKMGQICAPNKNQSGLVGYIASQCPTVGEGFLQAIRYSNLLSDNIKLELREGSEFAEFIYNRKGSSFFTIQSIELSLTNAVTLLRMKDKEFFYLSEVHFQYPAPDYIDNYKHIFGDNILFEQKENKIVFSASTLRIKNNQAQHYLHNVLLDHASKLLRKITQQNPFQKQVKDKILENIQIGNIGIDQIALKLNISRQTIYRRLKENDTTYQELLDSIRKELVEEYIATSSYSMTEITFLLGFSETSSFYRAYKRWFGCNPRKPI